MWDFLTKKCGIFGIEEGTKLWDFQHRGGDFYPLTSGHTVFVLYFLEKMETGIAWQIIFVTPNDVGDEQNKWLKLFDVDKEERRAGKRIFFRQTDFCRVVFLTVQERRRYF